MYIDFVIEFCCLRNKDIGKYNHGWLVMEQRHSGCLDIQLFVSIILKSLLAGQSKWKLCRKI